VTQGKSITKGITEQELELLLAEEAERIALAQVARPLVATALMKSYRTALRQMGAGEKVFDPIRLDNAIASSLGELVTNVSWTTKKVVRDIVLKGYLEGLSIAAIQRDLILSKAFDPARSLRIARTEATRNTNFGALAAMSSAADAGVPVRKMWITAGDAEVRDGHWELDGIYVFADEPFESWAGSPQSPGAFGEAGMDINCRCNLIPFVEEREAAEFSEERKPFREAELDTFFPDDVTPGED
jgi:hypothetical protein